MKATSPASKASPSVQTWPKSRNAAPRTLSRKTGKRSSKLPSSSTGPPTGCTRKTSGIESARAEASHVPALMSCAVQPAPFDSGGGARRPAASTVSSFGPSWYCAKPRTLLGPPAKNRFCGWTPSAASPPPSRRAQPERTREASTRPPRPRVE